MPSPQHPSAQSIDSLTTVQFMRTALMPGTISESRQTLRYGGGPTHRTPSIFVVYWGFNESGSDPSGEQEYLTLFLRGVGSSDWLNTVHQYYEMVDGKQHKIQNNARELKGWWVDPSSVPETPSDNQIQSEAIALEKHFGYRKNASYIIATPHDHNTPGFGLSYCAYHGYRRTPGGTISYTNLPYITDAGQACGQNFVNPGPSGLLDGVSIVEGQVLAESQTDPQPNTGWYRRPFGEIGEFCSWRGLGNITLSTGTFAVQPLWSNAADACVLSSP